MHTKYYNQQNAAIIVPMQGTMKINDPAYNIHVYSSLSS